MKIDSVAVAWLDRMPVLVLTGQRGAVRVVGADPVVRVLRVEPRQVAKASALELRGKPYPVKRAARILRRMGRAFGMTRTAKRLLQEVTG